MAVGDCEQAFAAAAAADGLTLVRARAPWLNQRGHLGLPDEAAPAAEVLDGIFLALGGDREAQASKRLTPLRGDFEHEATGTFIEVDERQHLTSYRLAALDLYPPGVALGFDIDEYRALCRQWSPKADGDYAHKAATGFGARGRPRQRAYNDSLRDLAAPAMGRPPVIRVPAPNRDGTAAYARVRERLRGLLD